MTTSSLGGATAVVFFDELQANKQNKHAINNTFFIIKCYLIQLIEHRFQPGDLISVQFTDIPFIDVKHSNG
jgi:hypothetical protein